MTTVQEKHMDKTILFNLLFVADAPARILEGFIHVGELKERLQSQGKELIFVKPLPPKKTELQ